jgi:hypothetical protein
MFPNLAPRDVADESLSDEEAGAFLTQLEREAPEALRRLGSAPKKTHWTAAQRPSGDGSPSF